MDKYSLVCEIFSTLPNEKVLDKFPILSLSIYKHDRLVTKRYLTARLIVTNHKLIIDRLSSINLLPTIIEPKMAVVNLTAEWKPQESFDIDYRFIHHIEFDKEINSLVIYTLMDRAIVMMKFMSNERTSKKIINLINKFIK